MFDQAKLHSQAQLTTEPNQLTRKVIPHIPVMGMVQNSRKLD
jgi:hypothetical protein